MTPAGTSNELDVQNGWEENTHTHTKSDEYNNSMYVWSSHIARVSINRVRLPILHVVNWKGKMNIALSASAPENLVVRDGFGSPVPRQPAHLILRLNLMLIYGIPPDFRSGVQTF